jgi:hypothetical protein
MNTQQNSARDSVESTDLFGIWVDAATQKPETGKKVIVCGHWSNGNRWRTIATWQPAGTVDASMWDETPDDWWDEEGNVCTNPTDEWSESPVEGERSYALENVTHWMPLPDMPNRRHRCKYCGKMGPLKPESKVFVCGYCKRREKV